MICMSDANVVCVSDCYVFVQVLYFAVVYCSNYASYATGIYAPFYFSSLAGSLTVDIFHFQNLHGIGAKMVHIGLKLDLFMKKSLPG